MGYPVAAGVTTHSGNYTPEIWSGKMLIKFYLSTVFGSIANTDYEGEIKSHGDTVKIRTVPDITINDYSIGQKLSYERPTKALVDLLIDKGKYYAIAINDVEKLQSDLNYVEKWTDDAGQQMGIEIDKDILENVYSDAHASNQGLTAGVKSSAYNLGVSGTPLAVTKANILDTIVDLGSVLDEQSIPNTDRWLVLPAILCGLIKKSDIKDASLAGDSKSVLRNTNNNLGIVDRFNIYMSNNVKIATDGADTVYNCIAGHPSAITFASQLTENETLKNPDDFGDLMRGLQVYGYNVNKPDAMAYLYVKKG